MSYRLPNQYTNLCLPDPESLLFISIVLCLHTKLEKKSPSLKRSGRQYLTDKLVSIIAIMIAGVKTKKMY